MNYQIPLYAAIELKEINDKYVKNRIYAFLKELLNTNVVVSLEIFTLTILAKKLFKSYGLKRFKSLRWVRVNDLSINKENPLTEKEAILKVLEGRVLMRSEILRELKKLEITENEISLFLQQSLNEGRCLVKPGISHENKGWQCNRCETKSNFVFYSCPKCGSKDCMACKECMNLGQISACEEIYFFHESSKDHEKSIKLDFTEINYDHPLTCAQEEVSKNLAVWSKSLEKEVLIWAVCGAGKTEVTFKIISQALVKSQKVMITIPRRDIVKELGVRIKRAFPETSIVALYGGSEKRYDPDSEIVICTTHQALKFFRKFDLAIIDEIDAYPYKGSDMLSFAVRRAIKEDGKVVMMTATPSKLLRRRAEEGELSCFKIPSRHHRQPLPVPKIFLCQEKLDNEKLPEKVMQLILNAISQKHKAFVFVPKRHMAEKVQRSLNAWLEYKHIRQIRVECCTSVDAKRNEKCENFAKGEIDIFIVTSILERGITIDRSNVVVLMADCDHIFDDNALIQMAGRSGRTARNPHGEVFFVCNQENKEIRSAVNQIKEMNHYAYERGYIDYK